MDIKHRFEILIIILVAISNSNCYDKLSEKNKVNIVQQKPFFLDALRIDTTKTKVNKVVFGDSKFMNCFDDGFTGNSCVFKKNIPDGIWIAYTDSFFSTPSIVASIKKNQYEGVYSEFSSTGNITLIGNYLNGTKNGTFLHYNSKSILSKIEEFKYGKLTGKFRRFNDSGNLVLEQIYNDNGEIITQVQYLNDHVQQVVIYSFDNSIKNDFFQDGKIKSQNYYFALPSKVKAVFLEWDKEGNLVSKDTLWQ